MTRTCDGRRLSSPDSALSPSSGHRCSSPISRARTSVSAQVRSFKVCLTLRTAVSTALGQGSFPACWKGDEGPLVRQGAPIASSYSLALMQQLPADRQAQLGARWRSSARRRCQTQQSPDSRSPPYERVRRSVLKGAVDGLRDQIVDDDTSTSANPAGGGRRRAVGHSMASPPSSGLNMAALRRLTACSSRAGAARKRGRKASQGGAGSSASWQPARPGTAGTASWGPSVLPGPDSEPPELSSMPKPDETNGEPADDQKEFKDTRSGASRGRCRRAAE